MQISVLAVGKLKEDYWEKSKREYLKRLQLYAKCEIKEVADERFSQDMSYKEYEQIKDREGQKIERLIAPASLAICLDRRGEMLSSEEFAELIRNFALRGTNKLNFIIGGSLGLSAKLLDKADLKLSFSKFTFPHQLMRIILLEQLYRAFKIIKNEPYHL